MVHEATLESTENGLVPEGEGWFVINAREARWFENDLFGRCTGFDGDVRFPEPGINIGVLDWGQPAAVAVETGSPKEAYAPYQENVERPCRAATCRCRERRLVAGVAAFSGGSYTQAVVRRQRRWP